MKLTIFTPTYNRAYILPKLYQSLCVQTVKSFEWLIVDDGSRDSTRELVEGWIVENLIPIRYIFQENGGKMRAHNRGALEAHSELFICVDSDDYLVEVAVELICQEWDCLSENDEIGGIVAYKKIDKKTSGFPKEIICSTLFNLYQNGFIGDTSLIYKTKVLKQYLFPEIEGEKFVTEAYVYNQIDLKYVLKILRKEIIVCTYLEDGYTNGAFKLYRDNPKGWAMYYYQLATLMPNSCKMRIRNFSYFICFSLLSKQYRQLFMSRNVLQILFCFPFGLYLKYRNSKLFLLNLHK